MGGGEPTADEGRFYGFETFGGSTGARSTGSSGSRVRLLGVAGDAGCRSFDEFRTPGPESRVPSPESRHLVTP